MYQIKDYRLRVCTSVKSKGDVKQQAFALACMFGCRRDDMMVLDEKTGIEIPLAKFE